MDNSRVLAIQMCLKTAAIMIESHHSDAYWAEAALRHLGRLREVMVFAKRSEELEDKVDGI